MRETDAEPLDGVHLTRIRDQASRSNVTISIGLALKLKDGQQNHPRRITPVTYARTQITLTPGFGDCQHNNDRHLSNNGLYCHSWRDPY